ncbi:MAG: hypothetical protein AAF630_17210 [Cyanobacteria bacterium P01_C01_bin.38]
MLNLQSHVMCSVLVLALTVSFLVNGLSAFSLLALSFRKDSYDMLNDRARTL